LRLLPPIFSRVPFLAPGAPDLRAGLEKDKLAISEAFVSSHMAGGNPDGGSN